MRLPRRWRHSYSQRNNGGSEGGGKGKEGGRDIEVDHRAPRERGRDGTRGRGREGATRRREREAERRSERDGEGRAVN